MTLIVFVVIGLSVTGCSNQMAVMQDNQANLQTLVQENARQMTDVVACIRQSQVELQSTTQNLRDTTQQLSDDMAQVTSAHSKLEHTVDQKNAIIAKRVESVEQSQQALSSELFDSSEAHQELAASIDNEEQERAALARVVEDNRTVLMAQVSSVQDHQIDFQTELKSLKATIQMAVADISTVAKAQVALEETVNTSVVGQIASLQEAQSRHQTQLDHSSGQIEKLLTGLAGLETNLTQLERIFKEDMANMSKAVELASHRQETYESKVNLQTQAVSSTVKSVEQGQMSLAQQVGELQSTTETMIYTLKTDLQAVRDVVAEIKTLDIDTIAALSSDNATP